MDFIVLFVSFLFFFLIMKLLGYILVYVIFNVLYHLLHTHGLIKMCTQDFNNRFSHYKILIHIVNTGSVTTLERTYAYTNTYIMFFIAHVGPSCVQGAIS